MSQNLIDITLDTQTLGTIDSALDTLETQLAGLLALTPEKRQELNKMGDKSEAFCRLAADVLGQNPDILPRNFDYDAMRRDFIAIDQLRPRMMRVAKLQQKLIDTEMALGSDLMTGALEGYAFLKVAGKGEGLDQLRKMLAQRFTRSAGKPEGDGPAVGASGG